MAPDAGKRQDGASVALDRLRRTHQEDPGLIQQVDDRPHVAPPAIEAAVSLLTMKHGVIPPTINYDNPDPAIDLDVVPNVKRSADVATVLSNWLRRSEHLPCHGAEAN
jgi:hypothetical protein